MELGRSALQPWTLGLRKLLGSRTAFVEWLPLARGRNLASLRALLDSRDRKLCISVQNASAFDAGPRPDTIVRCQHFLLMVSDQGDRTLLGTLLEDNSGRHHWVWQQSYEECPNAFWSFVCMLPLAARSPGRSGNVLVPVEEGSSKRISTECQFCSMSKVLKRYLNDCRAPFLKINI